MRLYFMLAFTRSTLAPNPVLLELFEILHQRGHQIELGVASELMMDPAQLTVRNDLYVLKSHAPLWLSLAEILHLQHAHLLNPYLACMSVQNKIVAAQRLLIGGIPTPRTWVTGDLNLLNTLAEEHPLIIKPYIGGRGVGIVTVRNSHELAALPTPLQPVLVQEYIQSSRDELKVYVIGDQVLGIYKDSSSLVSMRRPYSVSDQVRAIALRCGRLFGLGLYGLDVLETPDGPVVIDLNYFPSYKGLPEAAGLLADYVEGYARADIAEPVPTEMAEPRGREEIGHRRFTAAETATSFPTRIEHGNGETNESIPDRKLEVPLSSFSHGSQIQ